MNVRNFLFFVLVSTLLYSCASYKINKEEKTFFSSNGFALLYNVELNKQGIISKKISNDKLHVVHNFLKTNTPIKIVNPENLKFIETKVYKKGNYPKIFNIVLSEEIFSILELDVDNPFVEVYEVKKNKTFIAKKSNTFEEEKNVAEMVPIDKIDIDDLSKSNNTTKKKGSKIKNYSIVINDFYYKESANNLMKELKIKTKFKNIMIKKINDNKYRLLVGPFKNFNALKTAYISLNNLGFDYLDIYKN